MSIIEKLREAKETGEIVVLHMDRGSLPVGVVREINKSHVVIDEFGTDVAYNLRFIEDVHVVEESVVEDDSSLTVTPEGIRRATEMAQKRWDYL